jgi:hypothetical protein
MQKMTSSDKKSSYRRRTTSGDHIYCSISGLSYADEPKRICEECKRTIASSNGSSRCNACGTFRMRLTLGVLDSEEIGRHEKYVKDGMLEWEKKFSQ